MRKVVVAGLDRQLYLVPLPAGPVGPIPWDSTPDRAVARLLRHGPDAFPEPFLRSVSELAPEARLSAIDTELAHAVAHRTGRSVEVASLDEARRARARLPPPEPVEERVFLRSFARGRLETALRSPAEILITLAREEERVERVVGRERRASESFVEVPTTALAEYSEEWARARAALEGHYRALRSRVEAAARELLPNLSAVVGAITAARLLEAAGSLDALGRIRGPRLQLLGARRRPSADHGPRFGVLYRADRMEEVPPPRRAAYARSLAALGAIAARADASTRARIAPELVARRDRRIERLRRRAP